MSKVEASSSAQFAASVKDFTEMREEEVLGGLCLTSGYAIEELQRNAWVWEIRYLQTVLKEVHGWIFFEFIVPRLGSRIDAVLLIRDVLVVIEFKVGEKCFTKAASDQVWDYALDLKNFHQGSANLRIVPVLIPSRAPLRGCRLGSPRSDGVYDPVLCAPEDLTDLLAQIPESEVHSIVDCEQWVRAPYWPTPTIIEAAQALYANHSVVEISRHGAGAKNLATTSKRVEELIGRARCNGEKLIIFVTGVPGAGKTLVGLNVATRGGRNPDITTHSVFLSGNGPLVKVLSEALVRDEQKRQLSKKKVRVTKKDVRQSVKAFIQNVHHFRDEGVRSNDAPVDHVVIFDEAQRAWDLAQTSNFMRQKKGNDNFEMSEPEFLISYMDRHPDWAVIVCLVGGGQEINTGEAGIAAWLDAVHQKFPLWHAHISAELHDSEYAAGRALELLGRGRARCHFDNSLHLPVSMRSFKAEGVSQFVKAMLDCEHGLAIEQFSKLKHRYPIVLTRDLSKAKQWLRRQARGRERFGLVASSAAYRLKPHAIDVRVEIDPVHWFLSNADDPRSSYFLEDAATEFQVQGLELDWACVTWDADFRHRCGVGWGCYSFRGDRWQNVNKETRQSYLKNAYRVLLTRARQGMVIFVPNGEGADSTRDPSFYDSTYAYLESLGLDVL